MTRRVLLAGLLGAVVLVAWTVVINVGFRFTARIAMEPIPNERAIYELLKEHVRQPGAYMANPAPTRTGAFPDGEPVFGVRYGGVGHEAAGGLLLVDLLITLISTTLVAGLLSVTSPRVLSRFFHRVLFISAIGLLLAVSGDLATYGIGGYPLPDSLLLGANRLGSWGVAGVVMAWGMQERSAATTAEAANRAATTTKA